MTETTSPLKNSRSGVATSRRNGFAMLSPLRSRAQSSPLNVVHAINQKNTFDQICALCKVDYACAFFFISA
jgi:hypothetical protein